MAGKFSRDKGRRGELDVLRKLGKKYKHTGVAYSDNPDLTSEFAVISVKNKSVGGAAILAELIKLEAKASSKHHFVVFKASRGTWLCAERLEQHIGDHEGG